MKSKDMKSSEKVTVLRSILDASALEDCEKTYLVQSFLLNWTTSERVSEILAARER